MHTVPLQKKTTGITLKMGGSLSKTGNTSRCDNGAPVDNGSRGPPPMKRVLSVEERMWEKVRSICVFQGVDEFANCKLL